MPPGVRFGLRDTGNRAIDPNPTAWEFYSTAAEDALYFGPTPSLRRFRNQIDARTGFALSRPLEALTGALSPYASTVEPSALLSPEEAAQKYGLGGALKFEEPIREDEAALLWRRKLAEQRRQRIISLGTADGGVMRKISAFGVGLVASALDPLNVASAFVPVVGQAGRAGMVTRTGPATTILGSERAAELLSRGLISAETFAARTGTRPGTFSNRLLAGAVEGTVGAAMMEPFILGQASFEQADYTAIDSLINLGFGAALGAGLQSIGGAIADRLGRAARDIAEASPEAQAKAGDVATSQLLEDKVVDGPAQVLAVDPVVRMRAEIADIDQRIAAIKEQGAPSPDEITINAKIADRLAQDEVAELTPERVTELVEDIRGHILFGDIEKAVNRLPESPEALAKVAEEAGAESATPAGMVKALHFEGRDINVDALVPERTELPTIERLTKSERDALESQVRADIKREADNVVAQELNRLETERQQLAQEIEASGIKTSPDDSPEQPPAKQLEESTTQIETDTADIREEIGDLDADEAEFLEMEEADFAAADAANERTIQALRNAQDCIASHA